MKNVKGNAAGRTLVVLILAWSLTLAQEKARTVGTAADSLTRTGSAMSWKTSMVSDTEPGERLVVSGTVYAPDGVSPLGGVVLYVYQTDATGHYSNVKGDRTPRLRAWLRTNGEGKYELRTIKPAPYPGGGVPAHIHVKASPPGKPEQGIDEFLFEGDPSIPESDTKKYAGLGRFSPVLKVTPDSGGVGRSARDIRIK